MIIIAAIFTTYILRMGQPIIPVGPMRPPTNDRLGRHVASQIGLEAIGPGPRPGPGRPIPILTSNVFVRGKTKPLRRALSMVPNLKSSRPLNRWQSDLQEASVYQSCPPTMEVLEKLLLWGHNFSFFEIKIGNY